MLPYPPVPRSVPVPGRLKGSRSTNENVSCGREGEEGEEGNGVTGSLETRAQGAADQLSDVFIAATSSRIYKYPDQPVPASPSQWD